jgi:N-acetylglucosamine kinase-like BadF-type ATPase
MKDFLTGVFKKYFTKAIVSVYEDTYAAAFGTTPKGEQAIVCILGTGSNCSYFDGKVLHQKVQSLGYIAMDDCSGNRFGRHLLRGYYFNKMPKDLAKEFEEEYNLDPDYIKHNLYKEPNPNAYLATFAKFLIKHKNNDYCKKIIQDEMKDFVENYILQFENCHDVLVHFVGSIAFYLKDELVAALEKYDLKVGNVLRRPIDGMIAYHVLNK